MIRYRNISTGCGTLLPATSMTSSSRAIALFCCGAAAAAVIPRSLLPMPVQPAVTRPPGLAPSRRRWLEPQRQLDEQARAESGGSHRPPRVVHRGHHGSADVEVAERDVACERLEEQPCGDRPGVLAAHVLDVRDLRVQLAAVALDQRQLPDALV